jgi:hypothetical protein
VRHLIRIALAVALLLLLATPTLAQGSVIIKDPGSRLDANAVRQAARALVSRKAAVAVYVVDSGGQADFAKRLIADGLARSDGTRRSDVIAIYIALAPQNYSSIIFGDQWSDALAVNDNYEVIRKGDLNPGLSDRNFTLAVVTALGAIDKAIASPPVPGGGTVNNINLIPLVLGIGVLALAAVGGTIFVNSRRSAKTRADAQQRLKDAREGAGSLIAEMGRRFTDAAEKAKYDKLSYTAADVTRVQNLQRDAVERFTKLQTLFDDTAETLERYPQPTNEQLAQATAGYEQVKVQAQQASESLKVVEELRIQLDDQARQAREELDRAKKA